MPRTMLLVHQLLDILLVVTAASGHPYGLRLLNVVDAQSVASQGEVVSSINLNLDNSSMTAMMGANSTGSSPAFTSCPITEEALAQVDLSAASVNCADIGAAGFCSSCLCAIATALVTDSPVFASLAANPTMTDLNLNTLVEQCAGSLGPALLAALRPDALTALAACDLNGAAALCSNSTPEKGSQDITASQGPATATAAQPAPAPARQTSSAARHLHQGLPLGGLAVTLLALVMMLAL